MARIRTIKPEFWDDIKLSKISRDARLLYIGLWNFADDLGVIIGDLMWIKSKVFPFDQIQVQQFDKWITDLVKNGFICQFTHLDVDFIYLPNLTRHQVINRPNLERVNIQKCELQCIIDSLINHGNINDSSYSGIGKGIGIRTPIIPPQGDGELYSRFSFENVWELYGRKGNKKTSAKKWENLKNHCREAALAHIPSYVESTPDKQYRKNFETYLNQECWNDEVIFKKQKQNETERNMVYIIPESGID